MQQKIYAGDTLNFLTGTPGYSAADGWVLKWRLIPRTTGTPISLTSTPEGSDHRTQVGPTVTAVWVAGDYTWVNWVERLGETYTIGNGQITIDPDPRTAAAGYDGRSLSVKTLADLKVAFAGWTATNGNTRSYKIADREKEFKSAEEIIQQIAFWEREVQREITAAASANGTNRGGRMYVRMGR